MTKITFPLPWEQVRWRTRRFAVSDFRFVTVIRGAVRHEVALHDVRAIEVEPSIVERITGIGTLIVHSARPHAPAVRVPRVMASRRSALRLNLLIADLRGIPPDDSVAAFPLPRIWRIPPAVRLQTALIAPAIVLLTLAAIVIGLSGHEMRIAYSADDPIRPRGVPRPRAEIVEFMKREVMPFAQEALAPIVGREHVRCETCHGTDAEARQWRMPAVEALPEPDVRRMATAAGDDSQVRNALHGYLAEEDKQPIAARMRGVVLPGMARLLQRPPYDFTQPYEYNLARAAFGCYHCHMVKE